VSPELATGEVEPVPAPGAAARKHRVRRPRSIRGATSVLAQSTPLVWLTGGGLVISLAMVVGLLVLVLSQGVATFWPGPLVRLELDDGRGLLGEVTRVDEFRPGPELLAALPEERRNVVAERLAARDGEATRRLLRTGNYELTNEHFTWVTDYDVARETRPEWALLVERQSWGRFYGEPLGFLLVTVVFIFVWRSRARRKPEPTPPPEP
jgi:phosphate transport system permease protein